MVPLLHTLKDSNSSQQHIQKEHPIKGRLFACVYTELVEVPTLNKRSESKGWPCETKLEKFSNYLL